MSKQSENKFFIYVVGVIAALAGLLFGVDIGIISGARPLIAEQFHLNTAWQEYIVSGVLYGAVVGTILSGPLSRLVGRRMALLVSAIVFIIGAAACGLAPNAEFLLVARCFLGLAVGVASFTSPLYLSEVAPKKIRGGLIATYQLMITIGILAAYIIDLSFSYTGDWRWMLGSTAIPAVLLFAGVIILPKSPRWLMLKGRDKCALNVLERIRLNKKEIIEEAAEIKASLKHSHGIWDALASSAFVKVLFLGMMLQIIQQLSGINVIIYYAPQIYKLAGFASPSAQLWGTVLIGLINMLTTFFAIGFVDKFGRRPILIGGLIIMCCSQFIQGILFHNSIHGQAEMFLVVAMMLTFIIGFAASVGPIMWIVCAEIFPIKSRDFGITATTTMNWIANAVIGSSALTMFHMLGNAWTFWTFAITCFLSLLFVIYFCPETRGVSLEKIEDNLLACKRLRKIGR